MSKLKTINTKLGDWIDVVTLLQGRSLKQSLIDKKLDQKEDDEKNHNHYMTKGSDFMKNTQFIVEEVSGNFLKEYSVSHKEILNIKIFQPKRRQN